MAGWRPQYGNSFQNPWSLLSGVVYNKKPTTTNKGRLTALTQAIHCLPPLLAPTQIQQPRVRDAGPLVTCLEPGGNTIAWDKG